MSVKACRWPPQTLPAEANEVAEAVSTIQLPGYAATLSRCFKFPKTTFPIRSEGYALAQGSALQKLANQVMGTEVYSHSHQFCQVSRNMLGIWDDVGTTLICRFDLANILIAAEVLWNLLVKDGKTEEVRYRSYYEVLANAPKTAILENMLTDSDGRTPPMSMNETICPFMRACREWKESDRNRCASLGVALEPEQRMAA